ncbi:hypothetical protein LXM94_15440 [Rhizobium sp. TRM95111]|uniref:hypothetical protein n=1 Tax=Rhizobium alarense TaxID=2846851 RepID=UPI001F46B51A|nr:hypothetical protein [Rhizobium alarense]MCF3641367.1 hypothetical protein [Rhizobium alarense]
MSNTLETRRETDPEALALYLENNDGDDLTDLLVEALTEAFRILDEDLRSPTVH